MDLSTVSIMGVVQRYPLDTRQFFCIGQHAIWEIICSYHCSFLFRPDSMDNQDSRKDISVW